MTDQPALDPVAAVVVRRDDEMPATVLARTPHGLSDVCLRVLSPVRLIATRALRTGIQAALAMLTARAIPAGGFADVTYIQQIDLHGVLIVAGFAAAISALQNASEILARLDEKAPEYRA